MDDPIAKSAKKPVASAMERLRQRDQVASTYSVVVDREWAKEHLEVVEAIARAERLGEADPMLEARRAELEKRRGDAVVEFKFRHCSPVRYESLLNEYRPTAEQRQQAEGMPASAQPRWAPGFRPALVAAVVVEPKLTEEEIVELFGEEGESILSPGEAMELFVAAIAASNNVPRFVPADL